MMNRVFYELFKNSFIKSNYLTILQTSIEMKVITAKT